MKNWFWIGLISVLLGACLDDPECLRKADTALVISFKKIVDGKADTLIFYNISAAGSDSVFYKDQPEDVRDTLSTVVLTVNPYLEETTYTFQIEGEQVLLKVGYKSRTKFISEDCGSEQLLYDLKILETQFDSVRIVNPVLTTARLANIEIYH
jgi:hypothetical protein